MRKLKKLPKRQQYMAQHARRAAYESQRGGIGSLLDWHKGILYGLALSSGWAGWNEDELVGVAGVEQFIVALGRACSPWKYVRRGGAKLGRPAFVRAPFVAVERRAA